MNATDDINYDMTHEHAGNGWAIVQDLGDNFWRVVALSRDGVDARYAPVAWGQKLKRSEYPVDDTPNAMRAPRKRPEQFHMGQWDCGTTACVAGWAWRLARPGKYWADFGLWGDNKHSHPAARLPAAPARLARP